LASFRGFETKVGPLNELERPGRQKNPQKWTGGRRKGAGGGGWCAGRRGGLEKKALGVGRPGTGEWGGKGGAEELGPADKRTKLTGPNKNPKRQKKAMGHTKDEQQGLGGGEKKGFWGDFQGVNTLKPDGQPKKRPPPSEEKMGTLYQQDALPTGRHKRSKGKKSRRGGGRDKEIGTENAPKKQT